MKTRAKVIMSATIIAAFLLTQMMFDSVWAVECPIPDTGQTKCYDNTQEIPCPQLGEPFYGQDAQYICNPQSYTKLDENGNDLPDDATEWVTVRDNVTGLIWEVETNDGGIHDVDNHYAWDEISCFLCHLNGDNFGGHNDWRLPTNKELLYLANYDKSYPAINTTYFPNSVNNRPPDQQTWM